MRAASRTSVQAQVTLALPHRKSKAVSPAILAQAGVSIWNQTSLRISDSDCRRRHIPLFFLAVYGAAWRKLWKTYPASSTAVDQIAACDHPPGLKVHRRRLRHTDLLPIVSAHLRTIQSRSHTIDPPVRHWQPLAASGRFHSGHRGWRPRQDSNNSHNQLIHNYFFVFF